MIMTIVVTRIMIIIIIVAIIVCYYSPRMLQSVAVHIVSAAVNYMGNDHVISSCVVSVNCLFDRD